MIDTLHMSTPVFVAMLVAYAVGISLTVMIGAWYSHRRDERRMEEVKRTHKGW